MQNSSTTNLALLVGRICIAALFLIAAYNKVKGYDFYLGYFTKLGVPMPAISTPLIIAFETISGLCMLVGFKVRLIAPVIGLYAIGAALFAHTNLGDPNHLNHALKNVAILGGLLAFMITGAGAYAVDKS
jgi:putative oxidoreductase